MCGICALSILKNYNSHGLIESRQWSLALKPVGPPESQNWGTRLARGAGKILGAQNVVSAHCSCKLTVRLFRSGLGEVGAKALKRWRQISPNVPSWLHHYLKLVHEVPPFLSTIKFKTKLKSPQNCYIKLRQLVKIGYGNTMMTGIGSIGI